MKSYVYPFGPAIALAAMVAFSSAHARGGGTPPSGMDLTGTWTLNVRESGRGMGRQGGQPDGDGPRRRGGRPGGDGPGMGGGPGDGGFGGGPRGAVDPEKMRRMRERMQPAPVLAIEQTDEVVTIGTPERPGVIVVIDGRRRDTPWLDGDTAAVMAKWTETGLLLERKIDDATIRETYSRLPGATRLIVTVEASGDDMPRRMSIRRVYDLVPAEPPAAE